MSWGDQDRERRIRMGERLGGESQAEPRRLTNAEAAATAAPVDAPSEADVIAPPRSRCLRIAGRSADARHRRDRAGARRARRAPGRGSLSSRRTQALTLVPSRTTDPVPVVVGGVLALVMLTVFGAAAAMTKLATLIFQCSLRRPVGALHRSACGRTASRTIHSWPCPQAGHSLRTVLDLIRSRFRSRFRSRHRRCAGLRGR